MKSSESLVPNREIEQEDVARIHMQLVNNDPEVVSNLPAS